MEPFKIAAWLAPAFLLLLSVAPPGISAQTGVFTAFFPSKLQMGLTSFLEISSDVSTGKNPPPIRFYIDCPVRLSSRFAPAEPNLRIDIVKIPTWTKPQYKVPVPIPATLSTEAYTSCSLVAANVLTAEVLDSNELELESAQELQKNPDRLTRIHVQMDKPAYKPNDEARVRLVFLDKTLLPTRVTNTPIEITILDSKKLLVMNMTDPNWAHPNGIYNFSFPFSDKLNVGVWTLNATAGGLTEIRNFTVQKYVLPKFLVTVNPELPYIVAGGGVSRFQVEIQAKYTYGKSLYGNFTLLFHPKGNRYSSSLQTKTGEITTGRVLTYLDVPQVPGSYHLEVNVSEKTSANWTGRWAAGRRDLEILREQPHILTWLEPTETYNPGFPMNVKISVSTPDGRPVPDSDSRAVCVSTYIAGRSGYYENRCGAIPQNGILTLSLTTPPISTATGFSRITASYRQKMINLTPAPRAFYSQSKISLDIVPASTGRNGKLQRGLTHNFVLQASQSVLSKVNYILWDGRNIVQFVRERVLTSSGKVNRANLQVPIPDKPFAELKLIVFFVHAITSGAGTQFEIISASTDLPTSNYVEITPSKTDFRPTENLTLTIKSHPGSTVAIRGIDQSVLLLNPDSNLDLDPKTVPFNEMCTDDFGLTSSSSSSSSSTGTYDFRREFHKTGLAVLTNVDPGAADRGGRGKRQVSTLVNGNVGVLTHRPTIDQSFFTGKVRTRSFFPEVWMWEEFQMQTETQTFVNVTSAPDTMTSWFFSAFSVNANTGLAVMTLPKMLTVFRPFFVTLNLPYSVVREETFDLQVLVHNYLDREVWVEVSFLNDRENFQFVDSRERDMANVTRWILVQPQSVDVVPFIVTPLRVGHLPVSVRAVADTVGDAIIRLLNVVRPTDTYTRNKVKKRIEIANSTNTNVARNKTTETIITRTRRSLDSRRLRFTGDALAATLQLNSDFGVSGIVDLDLGCGEQNLALFYPTVIAMDYMESLNKLTPALRTKGSILLQRRYQTQLTYYDQAGGHFSFMQAYMQRISTPSTWLTAYVLQCFTLGSARGYIRVDSSVLSNAVKFVLNQQQPSGEFREADSSLMGGRSMVSTRDRRFGRGSASFAYGVTAFVVLALIEVKENAGGVLTNERTRIERGILDGLRFISSENSFADSDGYSLAVVTAALHRGNHGSRDRFFDKLEQYARVTGDGDEEMRHYEPDRTTSEASPSSISVEMTAYALLSHLWRSQVAIANSASIVRWLYSRQSRGGNYYSTMDTVVATKALAEYARTFSFGAQEDEAIQISVTTGTEHSFDVEVNHNNSIDLKELFLPNNTKFLNISFSGHGVCHLDYEELHHRTRPINESDFRIRTQWIRNGVDKQYEYTLRLCLSVKEEGEVLGQTLAQIQLSSGYGFYEMELDFIMDRDNWISPDQEDDDHGGFTAEEIAEMERSNFTDIRSKKSGMELHILYSTITNQPACLNLPVSEINFVANNNKAHIHVFEYYNTEHAGTAAFDPAKLYTVCEICLQTGHCDITRGCDRTRR